MKDHCQAINHQSVDWVQWCPGKSLPSPTSQALGTRPGPGYRRYVTSGRISDNTLRPRRHRNVTSFVAALLNRFRRKNLTWNSITPKQIKILPLKGQILCQRLIQTCAAGKQKSDCVFLSFVTLCNPSSILGKGKWFFSSRKRQDQLWDPPSPQFSRYQGHEVDQLHLASLWIISGPTAPSVCVFKPCERKEMFRFTSPSHLNLRRRWILTLLLSQKDYA